MFISSHNIVLISYLRSEVYIKMPERAISCEDRVPTQGIEGPCIAGYRMTL